MNARGDSDSNKAIIYSGARSLLISRLALWCLIVIGVREGLAQERLIRFEQSEKWGYKNSLGKVVIEPQFEIAEDFSPEGMAAVVDGKGWAYIDRKGNIVVRPFNYDNGPDPFHEGLARFVADVGKIGFFNKLGRPVIQPRFGGAFYFKEGLAAVCIKCKEERSGDATVIKGGKWGYINRQGEMAIKPQYDRAFPFEKGLAQVCLGCSEQAIGEHSIVTGGRWGSINKGGKVVVSFRKRTEVPRGFSLPKVQPSPEVPQGGAGRCQFQRDASSGERITH